MLITFGISRAIEVYSCRHLVRAGWRPLSNSPHRDHNPLLKKGLSYLSSPERMRCGSRKLILPAKAFNTQQYLLVSFHEQDVFHSISHITCSRRRYHRGNRSSKKRKAPPASEPGRHRPSLASLRSHHGARTPMSTLASTINASGIPSVCS